MTYFNFFIDNLIFNSNSILNLETISTSSGDSVINVKSCVHFDGSLVISESSMTEIKFNQTYSLITYQCHTGEFKDISIYDPSICISEKHYYQYAFSITFKY